MVVVDTHALIWWTERLPELSRTARETLDRSNEVVVPAMVAWEIAMLEFKGRIQVAGGALAYINRVTSLAGVRLHPLSPSIAVRAARFAPPMSRDPGDRMVVSTAIELGWPLVSRDRAIQASGLVSVIW